MNNSQTSQSKEIESLALSSSFTPQILNALDKLSKTDQEVIKAALKSKIAQVPEIQAINKLLNAFTIVFDIAGQKSDPSLFATYAEEFYKKLMQSFPTITLEEVHTALKMGVYDEFGDYFGLNVKSFVFFVRSYLQCGLRENAKKNFQRHLQVGSIKTRTPAEKEVTNQQFVNDLYADFLKDENFISDYVPSYLFSFLENKGLIILSMHEKLAIKSRAELYYNRLNSQGKFNFDIKGRDGRIKIIARQFSICEYFDQCKAEGLSKIFNIEDSGDN